MSEPTAEDLLPGKPSQDRARGDGYADGLDPVLPLDLTGIDSVSSLVQAMGQTSFGARRVGAAAELFEKMCRDPETFVVLTVTGAMTVAKLGLLISQMIEDGMVQAVVATGALITHGLVEGQGMTHFRVPEGVTDHELFDKGYNRVYDTLESEANLDETQLFLNTVLDPIEDTAPMGTWQICDRIGAELNRSIEGPGPLKAAHLNQVPVFIPAFTDSELGLDFQVNNLIRARDSRPPLFYDAFKDLRDFASLIRAQKRTAIFTIGGGVPRNWAQQVGPYLDLVSLRLGKGNDFKRYQYAIRICPDPAHFGHLSGCTYSESVSWGKFVPKAEGGEWVEVMSDATIAWPLVVGAARERLKADLPLKKDLPNPLFSA